MNNEFPDRIRKYLNQRHISDEVLKDSQIWWNGHHIVIPIFDIDGKLLFNKYRRDPWLKDGPKYQYDKGSHVSLYNIDNLPKSTDIPVFITEGELDTLVLESHNYAAVSSTGGAGSFDYSWLKELSKYKYLYICYDSDDAGVKGAINVQALLPDAKIVLLPEDTKDVTDYFSTHSFKDWLELLKQAEVHKLPMEIEDDLAVKKDYEKVIRECKQCAQKYLIKQRDLKFEKKNFKWTQVIIDTLNKRIAGYESRLHRTDKYVAVENENDDNVQKAKKAYPISDLIKFNHIGFAKCLWHAEDSGSLKYYPQDNRVYCYGGCGNKDLIDVVMQIEGVDFINAIKKINLNG